MKKLQQYTIQTLPVEAISTDIPQRLIDLYSEKLKQHGVQDIFIAREEDIEKSMESASWQFEVIHRIEEDLDSESCKEENGVIPINSILVFDFAGRKVKPSDFKNKIFELLKSNTEVTPEFKNAILNAIAFSGSDIGETKNAIFKIVTFDTVNNPRLKDKIISILEANRNTQEEFNNRVLGILNSKIIILKRNGDIDIYERYMRSSSNLRAGGALMVKSGYSTPLRNIFSLGIVNRELELHKQQAKLQSDEDVEDAILQEIISKQIKVVPSKWEAHMSLSITNSHAIESDKMPVIRVVPDMQRPVTLNVKGLKKCARKENEPYKGLEETLYKILSGEKDDIQFFLEERITERRIETVDGCCVINTGFFDKMGKSLDLTKEEIMHFVLAQIRAPFIKGTGSKFDIKAYCDEFGIKTLVDIYGNEFDPRECDIIMPESMFKGSAYFKTWESYLEAVSAKYEFNGKKYDLFPNNEFIRVANINKAKNPYKEMTYQYLQATVNLHEDDLCKLADRFIDDLVKGITCNLGRAKKFLGLISKSNYENSMVSKAQGLLELNPIMFNSNMVQNALRDAIETSFWNMQLGRIPVRGSYHYIIGDLSVLFLNTPKFVSECRHNTLNDSDFCILGKGENYLVGHEGTTSVLHRSPQIHPSETRKVSFINKKVNPIADKYFGHLDGVIIFNSYEATALCMGGANL